MKDFVLLQSIIVAVLGVFFLSDALYGAYREGDRRAESRPQRNEGGRLATILITMVAFMIFPLWRDEVPRSMGLCIVAAIAIGWLRWKLSGTGK